MSDMKSDKSMSSKHKHDKDKDKDKDKKDKKDKESKHSKKDKDSKDKKDKESHHHHKKSDAEQRSRDKVIDDTTPAGQRHNFWAHEQIEPTDDPFEDDFGENITKPLRN
ncbi:DNA topoisomerase I-related protein [Trichomonas vaginalis G3]|uniref:DNA topoisomerase I-related protein n=1 Tax=Trichomonas vaginalis (strain ATCC PRA-98 / G3) TaxID=412133 RepID=A2DUD9_TRIV3|nr:hypothetical protein TVAGG3_0595950 [Trichomonas vaginalis G3]EAY15977.1 DNA topoisomerase I-related protein [Trichomonas vaginalis G3]KAI5523612.1 hypothetical protein TVAGG3_0595950 [Trichomonas vaginalis G3]|eukprot:XP_001328200.1 DNA topoisomerase I-related protein [Trichomonas vaginalis G3]